jgi:hypothetical protein
VLVIDGMKSSDDGMSIEKNNNNDGMITRKVCNQSSGGIAQSFTQSASVC